MSPSTRRGVTEQAAIAAIDSGTRVLRLPTIRDRFEEIAAAAQREQLSYLGFLAELVMVECDDRDKRRAARRIHDAGFPRDKRIEEFDFDANPNVNPAIIHQLATCAWVKAGHPLCLIGDSGTGKSHLLIGLGTAAAEAGHRVRYTLASKLVNELVEAADDKQLSKTVARYGRVDLLCLDELGYLELDRRGTELLFQVLTEREERSAIAIASNEPFSGWTKTFTDPRLCAADRRPLDLRRADHRDRHDLLPARPRPPAPRRRLTSTSRPARRRAWSLQSWRHVGHRSAPLPRPTPGHARPGTPTGRAPGQHRPGGHSR
jgi:DNA replication protein DnaC